MEMNDMEILYCPRCGNRLDICDHKDSYWEYPFECNYCDENFFRFECLNHNEFQSIFNGQSDKLDKIER